MGYETKLIIGLSHTGLFSENGMDYLSVIAHIDLCKSCFHDTYIDKDADTQKCFFYEGIETKVSEDKYGHQLFLIDPSKVLKIMKENNKGRNKYRRYTAAIPLLEQLIKGFEGQSLKCILFGH